MIKKIITLALIFISCNSKDFKHNPSDTVRTTALYYDNKGMFMGGQIFRVTKDTFAIDTLDKTKNVWQRDTLYFIPILVPLADTSGKPLLDSTGKPMTITQFTFTNKHSIIKDFDKTY